MAPALGASGRLSGLLHSGEQQRDSLAKWELTARRKHEAKEAEVRRRREKDAVTLFPDRGSSQLPARTSRAIPQGDSAPQRAAGPRMMPKGWTQWDKPMGAQAVATGGWIVGILLAITSGVIAIIR